jgi:type VI secretion system protein VasJ
MPDADMLNQIATQPIPGDSPTGVSVRYEEAFTLLESEIGKLENPAGGEVDWRQVEVGCAELLTGKSKDVLLAVWMTRAMLHRQGLSGLAAGIQATRGMLENFWDGLHPQRIKPRRGALSWLGDKLESVIDDAQLAADPAGAALCVSEIEAVVAWSADRFEGEDCGLLGLLSRLRSAPQPAAPEVAAAESSTSVESASGNQASVGPAGAGGPLANRAQAVARLKELATWWARHEPSSPMVPLLNRAVLWSEADFQAVFSQMLRNRSDAKDYMWDVLGIVEPPPA